MKNTLYIVLVIGVLLAVFLIGKKQNWWDEPEKDLDIDEYTNDPEPGEFPNPPTAPTLPTNIPGTKETPLDPSKPAPKKGFSAKQEAVQIALLLADPLDLSGEDVKAFKKILAYSVNELKSVCNAWVKTYPNGGGGGIRPTLREMVKSEVVWTSRIEAIQLKKDVLKRLDNLNIP